MFTGRPLERIYWLLVLAGAMGFVIYKICGFYQSYMQNDFRTEIRIVDAENLTFHGVRFCSKNIWNQIGSYCYKNVTNLGRSCDGNYLKMEYLYYPMSFQKDLFFPLKCLTINTSDAVWDANFLKLYPLVFSIHGFNVYDPYFEVGIGNFDFSTTRNLKAGTYNIQILNVQKIKRLKAPYKSKCSNGENGLNVFPSPYTKKKCALTIIFNKMVNDCGDVPDNWRKYLQSHHKTRRCHLPERQCAVHDRIMKDCIYKILDGIYNFEKEMNSSLCPLPCEETWIENSLITVKERPDKVRIALNLVFPSKRVSEITEVPVYTSDDFFSDVGSWLGLLVGMSFLSLVEIITFIFTASIERCM